MLRGQIYLLRKYNKNREIYAEIYAQEFTRNARAIYLNSGSAR